MLWLCGSSEGQSHRHTCTYQHAYLLGWQVCEQGGLLLAKCTGGAGQALMLHMHLSACCGPFAPQARMSHKEHKPCLTQSLPNDCSKHKAYQCMCACINMQACTVGHSAHCHAPFFLCATVQAPSRWHGRIMAPPPGWGILGLFIILRQGHRFLQTSHNAS